MEQYPTVRGIPVSPLTLELPESLLKPEKDYNWHNHHACYIRRVFGRNAILNTFRNLESNQYAIPKDVHVYLHSRYSPPEPPTPREAISHLYRAYRHKERLREGSNNNPIFRTLGDLAIKSLIGYYNELDNKESLEDDGYKKD